MVRVEIMVQFGLQCHWMDHRRW